MCACVCVCGLCVWFNLQTFRKYFVVSDICCFIYTFEILVASEGLQLFQVKALIYIHYNVMCVLSHFSHIQLFATPWTVAHRVPLSMGISRQEYWSGLPCPSSGCLPNLGIESMSLKSPTLVGRFFTTSATWEVLLCHQFSSVQLLSCI